MLFPDDGRDPEVYDLPTRLIPGDFNRRRNLDECKLSEMLTQAIAWHHHIKLPTVLIEDVRFLGNGAAGGYATASMMLSKGIIQGVCGAAGLPMKFVDAKRWQATFGIKGGKDGKSMSLEVARNLYPNLGETLKLQKHNNRADALLIGHWGLKHLQMTGTGANRAAGLII